MSQPSSGGAERSPLSHQISRRIVLRGGTLGACSLMPGAGVMFRTLSVAAINPVPAARMHELYEQLKTPYKYGVVIPQDADGHYDSPSVFRYAGA